MFKVTYIDDAGGTVETVVLNYHHDRKTNSIIFQSKGNTTFSVNKAMVVSIHHIEEEK